LILPPSTIGLPEWTRNSPGMVIRPPMNRTYCRYCIYSFCICQPLGSTSFHNTAYHLTPRLHGTTLHCNSFLGSTADHSHHTPRLHVMPSQFSASVQYMTHLGFTTSHITTHNNTPLGFIPTQVTTHLGSTA